MACRSVLSSECSFQLLLISTAPTKNTAKTKTLVLGCYPQTTLDIKKEIQKQLHIPTFAQTIQYEQITLSDSDSPGSVHVRNGDTLKITFECEADCIEVDEAVTRLRELVNHFQLHLPSLLDEIPSEGEDLLNIATQEGLMNRLQRELFTPWRSDVKQMNKRYFLHVGGVAVLLEAYSLILKQEWQRCTQLLKRFELVCLNALYHLVSTFKLRQVLIDRGCVELCMQSLLRAKLKKKEKGVEGLEGPEFRIIMDVIASAMGTLCNMCEVPEAHRKIGSNPEVLEQFIRVAQSPSYTCWCAQLSINAFVCLAHDVVIHPNLASPDVINGLMDACSLRRTIESESMELLLLEYFTVLFLAQLILVSPRLILPRLYSIVYENMSGFLSRATPAAIYKQEYESGCFWSVFLPYVKLPYMPRPKLNSSGNLADTPATCLISPASAITVNDRLNSPVCTDTKLNPDPKNKMNSSAKCSNDEISVESPMSPRMQNDDTSISEETPPDSVVETMSNLQQVSTETIVFSLRVMFMNEDSRKGLMKEKLCDFIVCLPSYLPDSLHEKAKELVSMLGAQMQLQPPKLSQLAKARLAKMYFGLERMLQVHSVNELYAELYP